MSEPIKRTESRFNESWPIGLLQACPRCGNETHNYLTQNESLWFDDFTAGCYRCNHCENRERWNLRPVEHKLEQQIAQLTNERDELRETVKQIKTAAYCRDLTDSQLITHIMTVADSWLERERNLVKERDQLAAKCASYKHVIQLAWEDRRDDSDAEYVGKLAEAKCNDQCGVGWLSPSERKKLEAGLVEINSPTWPWVRGFASEMERKLSYNRHKGDRAGWSSNSPKSLLKRLVEEVAELTGAILTGTDQQVLDEAADVANFAMMIADVSGGLKPHAPPRCVGWLSPEKKNVLVEALTNLVNVLGVESSSGQKQKCLDTAKQALGACK